MTGCLKNTRECFRCVNSSWKRQLGRLRIWQGGMISPFARSQASRKRHTRGRCMLDKHESVVQ